MLCRIMGQVTEWASYYKVQLDIPGFHPSIKISKDKLTAPMSGAYYIPKAGDYVFVDTNRMVKILIPAESMWLIGEI